MMDFIRWQESSSVLTAACTERRAREAQANFAVLVAAWCSSFVRRPPPAAPYPALGEKPCCMRSGGSPTEASPVGKPPSGIPLNAYNTVSLQGQDTERQAEAGGRSWNTMPQPRPQNWPGPPSLVVPYRRPSGPKMTLASG